MKNNGDELKVIRTAKDLCDDIFLVTKTSPKRFRFTLVSRMQELSLDIVAELYDANDVFMGWVSQSAVEERLQHQKKVITNARKLGYLAEISAREGALAMKHYANISSFLTDIRNMTGAWMNSDKKRLEKVSRNMNGSAGRISAGNYGEAAARGSNPRPQGTPQEVRGQYERGYNGR